MSQSLFSRRSPSPEETSNGLHPRPTPPDQRRHHERIDVVALNSKLTRPFYVRVALVIQTIWRALTINSKVAGGSAIVAFFLLVAIFGPSLLHGDPNYITHDAFLNPSSAHWLGTTDLGQDIFGQLILGTQTSVLWGFFSGLLVTLLSVVIGLVGGYFGGIIDEALSFVTNVFLVLPGIPLMLVIASYVPASALSVSLVVALTSWAWGARVLRAQTLSLRSREFVTAARSTGESTLRTIFFEVFPNQISLVAANFVSTMIQVILSFAALQFLGLGDITQTSWGTMLYWAQSRGALLGERWWWFIPPGLCIAVLGAGLSLINFGIDEVADPRLRKAPKIKLALKTKKVVA
ncbi:MAG TPA: ABC transporter permease [Ktedonobacteraceae bacterium]|nr:ABC transporter permease [Ktedonobacteraceae bacterium]